MTLSRTATRTLQTVIVLGALAAGRNAFADVHTGTLEQGRLYLETGKPDSAAVVLFDAVELAAGPADSLRSYYYLALAMDALGRYDERDGYFRSALSIGHTGPETADVLTDYARILVESGESDRVIDIYNRFVSLFPDAPHIPDMLYIAGNAFIDTGDYVRASNIFNDLIDRFPDTTVADEAVMKEGECLYHLQLLTGAMERFEEYLRNTPGGVNRADALFYLGDIYLDRDQPESARSMFKQLTLDYPAHPRYLTTLYYLGVASFNVNLFYEAENAFSNFTFNTSRDDSLTGEALFYLERIKYRTGEYGSETAIAENFIAHHPENRKSPHLLFDLGRYYRAAGSYDNAIEKYRILINNPLYTAHVDSAVCSIADTYAAMDDSQATVDFLMDSIDAAERGTARQKYFFKLATLYESWDYTHEAIVSYQRSTDIGISEELSFLSLRGIARIFNHQNRWHEAAVTLQRIIDEFPGHPALHAVYFDLAHTVNRQGRVREAVGFTETALVDAPEEDKGGILLFLAGLYEVSDVRYALRLYSLVYSNRTFTSDLRTRALERSGAAAVKSASRSYANDLLAEFLKTETDVGIAATARKIKNMLGTTGTSARNSKENRN